MSNALVTGLSGLPSETAPGYAIQPDAWTGGDDISAPPPDVGGLDAAYSSVSTTDGAGGSPTGDVPSNAVSAGLDSYRLVGAGLDPNPHGAVVTTARPDLAAVAATRSDDDIFLALMKAGADRLGWADIARLCGDGSGETLALQIIEAALYRRPSMDRIGRFQTVDYEETTLVGGPSLGMSASAGFHDLDDLKRQAKYATSIWSDLPRSVLNEKGRRELVGYLARALLGAIPFRTFEDAVALQTALDYAHRLPGGTVRLRPIAEVFYPFAADTADEAQASDGALTEVQRRFMAELGDYNPADPTAHFVEVSAPAEAWKGPSFGRDLELIHSRMQRFLGGSFITYNEGQSLRLLLPSQYEAALNATHHPRRLRIRAIPGIGDQQDMSLDQYDSAHQVGIPVVATYLPDVREEVHPRLFLDHDLYHCGCHMRMPEKDARMAVLLSASSHLLPPEQQALPLVRRFQRVFLDMEGIDFDDLWGNFSDRFRAQKKSGYPKERLREELGVIRRILAEIDRVPFYGSSWNRVGKLKGQDSLQAVLRVDKKRIAGVPKPV